MKLWPLLLLLSSCSLYMSGKEGPRTAKGTYYTISFSLPDWRPKDDKRSDYVYQNETDGRILLSNSFCNEFQEQSLEQLATKTFHTITEFKAKNGQYLTFQDREAYLIEGAGFVDGVRVNLRLLNTRRNNCYFDFLGISPEGTQESRGAFEQFIKAVDFK